MHKFILIFLLLPFFQTFAGTCYHKTPVNIYTTSCAVGVKDIPDLMGKKLWIHAESFMNHWFEGSGSNYYVRLSDIELMNSDFKNLLKEFKDKASANDFFTSSMQESLVKELKKTNSNFQSGLSGSFDHISTELSLIGEGWKTAKNEQSELRNFYSKEFGSSGDVSAFGAAYGKLTVRLVAAGYFDKEKITVTKIGVYVRDKFDFINDGVIDQPLGLWQKNYPYLIGRYTLSDANVIDSTYITNDDFRNYNEYFGNDPDQGNFRIFSNMREMATNETFYYKSVLPRSLAVKMIIQKFGISLASAGFNSEIFKKPIIPPEDVDYSTDYREYIITAYNKGIIRANSSKFRPKDSVTFAEFVIMMVRAIPVPLDNPQYKNFSYHTGYWYHKYLTAAYNAGIIENKSYSFDAGIQEDDAKDLLSKANDYFRGSKSGISIYAKWAKKYADIDLYLLNGNKLVKTKSDGRTITNMDDLKGTDAIVYWNKHSTNWGANLDYDSWGGNGSQPWSGVSEERITVDSQMVKRPGIYPVIFCHYDWNDREFPPEATVEWWGINAGRNTNVAGTDGVVRNFKIKVPRGGCKYAGRLKTSKLN